MKKIIFEKYLKQRFGSISFWHGSGSKFGKSGSGSEYLFLIFLIFFIKKFMSGKSQYLFLLPPKFRKGISQIKKKHLVLLFTLYSFGLFWCYPDPNQCFKWIRIREKKSKWIRCEDWSGSGSGQMQWIRIRNADINYTINAYFSGLHWINFMKFALHAGA